MDVMEKPSKIEIDFEYKKGVKIVVNGHEDFYLLKFDTDVKKYSLIHDDSIISQNLDGFLPLNLASSVLEIIWREFGKMSR